MKRAKLNVRYKEYDNGNVAVITRSMAGIRYEVLNPQKEVVWQKFVPFEGSSGRGKRFDLAKKFQDLFARKATNGSATKM